jgi:hypothetical protein
MTGPRDTTALIAAYLDEGPVELADRSYDAMRAEFEQTRQRRVLGRWAFPPRIPVVSSSARLVVGAAALIVFVVGISLVNDPNRASVASPSQSTAASETSATSGLAQSVTVLPFFDDGSFRPGVYALGPGFPVRVVFDVPSGWSPCSSGPVEQSVCAPAASAADISPGVSFLFVNNVVADPCSVSSLDPPVGPTVDDLVAAIAGLNRFEATAPIDIEVDGHPGKELVVTAPLDGCQGLLTWSTTDRTNGVSNGEINRIQVIDVDGTRIVVTGAWGPTADIVPAPPAGLDEIIDSIRLPD